MHITSESHRPADNLRVLAAAIPDLPERRWPICVLTACQLIGDMLPGQAMPLDAKRAVFNAVADGQTGLAIATMGGPGLHTPAVDERSALGIVIQRALEDFERFARQRPGAAPGHANPGLRAAF